jgi:hypothetical protein
MEFWQTFGVGGAIAPVCTGGVTTFTARVETALVPHEFPADTVILPL